MLKKVGRTSTPDGPDPREVHRQASTAALVAFVRESVALGDWVEYDVQEVRGHESAFAVTLRTEEGEWTHDVSRAFLTEEAAADFVNAVLPEGWTAGSPGERRGRYAAGARGRRGSDVAVGWGDRPATALYALGIELLLVDWDPD